MEGPGLLEADRQAPSIEKSFTQKGRVQGCGHGGKREGVDEKCLYLGLFLD